MFFNGKKALNFHHNGSDHVSSTSKITLECLKFNNLQLMKIGNKKLLKKHDELHGMNSETYYCSKNDHYF